MEKSMTAKRIEIPDNINAGPPQAEEIEYAVLSSCLFDTKAIEYCASLMEPNMFYKPAHEEIFRAMMWLYDNSQPVDQLLLVQTLLDRGTLDAAGGELYIAELTAGCTSAANIKYLCEVLIEKHQLRNLAIIGAELQTLAREQKTHSIEIIDSISSKLDALLDNRKTVSYVSMQDAVIKAHKAIVERLSGAGKIQGIPTGITRFDNCTNGLQEGNLVVIGAYSGMGKTSLALNFSVSAARAGNPVGFFSMEMDAGKLSERQIYNEAYFDIIGFKNKNIESADWKKLSDGAARVSELPIFIDPTGGLTISELRARAKSLLREKNIRLLVVDYIQLMSGKGTNRQEQIEGISRGLKSLAKELNIPLIALSQLSNPMKGREDKKPILTDLRNSGAIGQDADVVVFIIDPPVKEKRSYLKLYGINEETYSDADLERFRELSIMKNRQGPTVSMLILWKGEYFRFGELQ